MDKRIVITETQAAALRELGMGELVVMCPTVSETLHINLNRAASALVAPAPMQAELPNMPTAKPDTRRKNPGAPPNGRSRPVKEVILHTRYAAGVKKLRSNTLVEMAGVALVPIAETYKGEPVGYGTVVAQLGATGFTNAQAITAVRELEKKKLLTRCY
jgi:hypothetical protein